MFGNIKSSMENILVKKKKTTLSVLLVQWSQDFPTRVSPFGQLDSKGGFGMYPVLAILELI